MRFLPTLLTPAVLVSLVAVAVPVLADEPHSICVPGAPLHLSSVPSDPVATLINDVCSIDLLSQCCDQGASGRWTLECVQEAAWFAKHRGFGDVCGRDAWAQGVIAGTPQRYPRDFSMLALVGNLSGVPDSEGPLAAYGNITLSGFNLNWAQKEPVALVAMGGLSLANGQIAGSAHYGSYYSASNTVHFIGASAPTAPTQPIDFIGAAVMLQNASQIIKSYTATPAARAYGTITFTGSDPELNVFSLDASQLDWTYNYVFDVPHNSSVIVNVTGTTPTIQSAGFERKNGLTPERILWNFPDATRLRLSSVSLPGSVLAPSAAAAFSSGSILGTALVKSPDGLASFAFRRAPFQMPYVCSTPEFEPSFWNDDPIVKVNNCYNYANNVLMDHKGEPGRASGEWCQQGDPCFHAPTIAKYAANDGLIPSTAAAICPNQMTKVALFFRGQMGSDYHWWRQDQDSNWSDKLGPYPAKQTGITPEQVPGDTKLVGYFCTCSSRIQGHGHATID